MEIGLFKVVLEPHCPVYHPGQDVAGYLLVNVVGSTNCTGITIACKGKSFVYFKKAHSKGPIEYMDTKHLVYLSIDAWKRKNDSDKLEPDSHRFPFHFTLPDSLHDSLEGKHGYIRYKIQATCNASRFFDKKVKVYFPVSTIVDLNSIPEAAEPGYMKMVRQNGALCSDKGPVTVEIHLDRAGVVAGEEVKPTVLITNQGSATLKRTSIKLVKVSIYRAGTEAETVEHTLCKVVKGATVEGQEQEWTDVCLPMPTDIATVDPIGINRFNNGISVEYRVVVHGVFGGCKNIKVECPIYVGHIPVLMDKELSDRSVRSTPRKMTSVIKPVTSIDSEYYRHTLAPAMHSAQMNDLRNEAKWK